MIKISVIVPCYNTEKYIERCLKALERQSYKNFEVIVVNDCSTDNTKNILQKCKNKLKINLKIITNEFNEGPGASRSKAIKTSLGQYISFCDSDDWYEFDYLEKMIQSAEKNNSDIVFSGYQQVFDNSGLIKKHFFYKTEGLSKEEQLIFEVDSLCRMLVKREIVLKNPIPSLWNGEDMAIIPIWIAASNNYSIVSECLYNYFTHKGTLSMVAKDRVILSLEKSFNYIKTKIGILYKKECEFLGIRNYLYGTLLCIYKGSKNNEKVKELLDNFEKEFPKWEKNKYINRLPFYKRIFIWAAKNRLFFLMKILAEIHKILR